MYTVDALRITCVAVNNTTEEFWNNHNVWVHIQFIDWLIWLNNWKNKTLDTYMWLCVVGPTEFPESAGAVSKSRCISPRPSTSRGIYIQSYLQIFSVHAVIIWYAHSLSPEQMHTRSFNFRCSNSLKNPAYMNNTL